MRYFPITFVFEILCFLFCVVSYFIKRSSLIKLFIPFLLLTVCVEFIGLRGIKLQYRFIMYNAFLILEFIFYALIFSIHLRRPILKKITLSFIPVIVLVAVINTLFLQGFDKNFASYTSLFGSFFIVLFSCFYFYESIQPDYVDQQLSRQPFFWICSGLLIFYLGSVIVNALFEYLIYSDLKSQGIQIYLIIVHSLNGILYTSFCIGFYLCRNEKKTYSLQS